MITHYQVPIKIGKVTVRPGDIIFGDADILNGKYGSEHPLPSVRALVRKFSMSSATVLHAFED